MKKNLEELPRDSPRSLRFSKKKKNYILLLTIVKYYIPYIFIEYQDFEAHIIFFNNYGFKLTG